MDKIAIIIGYICMVCGGIVTIGFVFYHSLNFCYKIFQSTVYGKMILKKVLDDCRKKNNKPAGL